MLIVKMLSFKKLPRYVYDIISVNVMPDKSHEYWRDKLNLPLDFNWEKIHLLNFRCTIDSKLRSFYFKVFHRCIALNDFLFKIRRKDSPNCTFCNKREETIIHILCECDKVTPIWQYLLSVILKKHDPRFTLANCEKIFGTCTDRYVSYLFLLLKYYIYLCKFQNNVPSITAYKSFVQNQKDTEHYLAKKRNKLPLHFTKWKFEI